MAGNVDLAAGVGEVDDGIATEIGERESRYVCSMWCERIEKMISVGRAGGEVVVRVLISGMLQCRVV